MYKEILILRCKKENFILDGKVIELEMDETITVHLYWILIAQFNDFAWRKNLINCSKHWNWKERQLHIKYNLVGKITKSHVVPLIIHQPIIPNLLTDVLQTIVLVKRLKHARYQTRCYANAISSKKIALVRLCLVWLFIIILFSLWGYSNIIFTLNSRT